MTGTATQDTVSDSAWNDAAAMLHGEDRTSDGDAPVTETPESPETPQSEAGEHDPVETPVASADVAAAAANVEATPVTADNPTADNPTAETPAEPALPSADWSSSSTLQMKQYLLAVAAGITGVAVALGAIVYFMSARNTVPDADTVVAGDPVGDTVTDNDASLDGTDGSEQDAASESQGDNDLEQTPSKGEPAETLDVAAADDPGKPIDNTPPQDPEKPADAVAPVEDPLPPQEELQPGEKPEPEEPDELTGPEDLLVKDSFLDDDIPEVSPKPTDEEPADAGVGPTVDDNKIAGQPEPVEREVDVQAQLAVRLPAIELKDTSLADFLAVMERLTTVPMTVDLEALAWARVNLDTPISVNLEDASIEEILESALGAVRLGHVVEAHDVLVTVMNRKDTLRQHRFAVDDLIADDASEGKALMSAVQQFVKPETWAIHGGTATVSLDGQELAVSQTDQGILDVLLFLEQLRVARGLGQQSKYPHELLQVESPTLLAISAIDQRVSLNFSQPTRLGDILRRLGDDVGMRIVVDWRTAGQLGWSPATETTLVVEEKTLGDSLNALLRPLKLGFRIINSRTMQITTAERVNRRRQLEMYPLPVSNNMTAAEAAKQLHRAGALSDAAQKNTHFDPASGYLLTWLTQAEQIDLARAVHAMQP